MRKKSIMIHILCASFVGSLLVALTGRLPIAWVSLIFLMTLSIGMLTLKLVNYLMDKFKIPRREE